MRYFFLLFSKVIILFLTRPKGYWCHFLRIFALTSFYFGCNNSDFDALLVPLFDPSKDILKRSLGFNQVAATNFMSNSVSSWGSELYQISVPPWVRLYFMTFLAFLRRIFKSSASCSCLVSTLSAFILLLCVCTHWQWIFGTKQQKKCQSLSGRNILSPPIVHPNPEVWACLQQNHL